MKIKRFKLRDGVTKDDLIKLGFRTGGTWIKEGAELFLSRYFHYKETDFEFTIGIAFGPDIRDWNDVDNVLVLDDDFCQPYIPFYYDNYEKDITGFPTLEYTILKYNEFLGSLDILEEVRYES